MSRCVGRQKLISTAEINGYGFVGVVIGLHPESNDIKRVVVFCKCSCLDVQIASPHTIKESSVMTEHPVYSDNIV